MNLKTGIIIVLLSMGTGSVALCQSYNNSGTDYVRPVSQQTQTIPNTYLSFGLGMGGYYPYTGASYVENPTISLMCDHTIFKHVGPGQVNVGGVLAYTSIYSNYTDYITNYNYEQRWDYYVFGTRFTYSLEPFNNKNMETYATVMVAYYLTTFKFASDDPNYAEPNDPGYSLKYGNVSNFFSPGIFLGFRSWLSPRSSIWLELGYGYTSVNFGASYRI